MIPLSIITKSLLYLFAFACAPCMYAHPGHDTAEQTVPAQHGTETDEKDRTIAAILVSGNKHVPTEAILDHIPYKVGEVFDPSKTRTLIHNLYYTLKRFRTISVKAENVGADK